MINYASVAKSIRNLIPTVRLANVRDKSIVSEIHRQHRIAKSLSPIALQSAFQRLREDDVSRNERLIASMGLMIEAIDRSAKHTLQDDQIHNSLLMARESIVEMPVGNARTFSIALAVAGLASQSNHVHVITPSDLVAHSHFQLLFPALHLLGLTSAVNLPSLNSTEKRLAYSCHVTFGHIDEFIKDCLHDHFPTTDDQSACLESCESVNSRIKGKFRYRLSPIQSRLTAAVIDEADYVMLDHAMYPVSVFDSHAVKHHDPDAFQLAKSIAESLSVTNDFILDPHAESIRFTKVGIEKVHQATAELTKPVTKTWNALIEQALVARCFLEKDRHYAVQNEQVEWLQAPSARVHLDWAFDDGLLQSIQAKESIPITAQVVPQARMTPQRYLLQYELVCGAASSVKFAFNEFDRLYKLDCHTDSTTCSANRVDLPLRSFTSAYAKESAIIEDVVRRNLNQQPILVAVESRKSYDVLAQELRLIIPGLQCLDGSQPEKEASLIAQAGQSGAVTLMLGFRCRGTEIQIDSNARQENGLHVIVAEPMPSRRVELEVIALASRHGEAGSSQAYASPDDLVLREFSPSLAQSMLELPHESGEISVNLQSLVEQAQQSSEQRQVHIRRQLLNRDLELAPVIEPRF
jgi:preprotein translocase subunit SecA